MSLKPYALTLVLLALWEAAVRLLDVPAYLVPAPSAVAVELWTRRAYLLTNTPATVYEIWAGFAIALVVGIALAVPVALTRFGDQAIMPVLVATQSVPKSALAPIFVIWFGFGLLPKVIVAALLAFFPIVVNMVRGLRAVEPEMVQYLSTLGARRTDVFLRLRLPSSLPYLFAAMKVSISMATVGAIVGEFIGSDQGLGYVILRAISNFDTTVMFAGLTVVSLIGVLSYGVISLVERRVLAWQPDAVEATAGSA
ncbi:MAG TPA: ABC transporter permease [Cellulomonas sp.]